METKKEDTLPPINAHIQEILSGILPEPGVYLMKDHQGRVIYVGKAQNLRHRVRSYFNRSGDERRFVSLLDRLVAQIETIITNNEKEALLLENNLIKKYKPRFNVKLVDDKNYLVLRLDPKAKYPRLEVVRKIQRDGARYFGPYHSAGSCRQTLKVVNRHFKLRTCTDQVMAHRSRPCLQYQIKRCDAPCVYPISEEKYHEQVNDVTLFLEGKDAELINRLRERMKESAREMAFETAASLRDQIQALEKTLEEQRVISTEFIDQDIFGLYRKADELTIAVLHVRQGKLIGHRTYFFQDQEFPDEEAISSFIGLYYDFGNVVPDEVLLPLQIEDRAAKEEWLREQGSQKPGRHRKVVLLSPQRGDKIKLVELANKNAAAAYQSKRHRHDDIEESLGKLQKRLGLKRIPRRIECYDISHLQGTYTVASRVVFVDGEPAKSEYRTYKIKTSKNDDFASMYEVMARRFRRAKGILEQAESAQEDSTADAWALPDLIVIDGGKGQLASAWAAAKDMGMDLSTMDMIGLAKEREDESGTTQPDRVFLPRVKDPIKLRTNTVEMFVLSQIRDEAHRFAVTFHKNQRSKQSIRSKLSDIPGIGPRRQKELLKKFGSIKRIQAAKIEELATVNGMNMVAAKAVLDSLGSPPAGMEQIDVQAQKLAQERDFVQKQRGEDSPQEMLDVAEEQAQSEWVAENAAEEELEQLEDASKFCEDGEIGVK